MARAVDPSSLEIVVRALRGQAEGATVEELAHSVGKLPRRTLQRRLAQLVQDGRVLVISGGKHRRYRLTGLEPALEELVVSPSGAEVRALVRRPLIQRAPVGYRREFLKAYRPNRDAYLAPALRSHLHAVGRAPGDPRPAGTYARQILNRLLIDLSWASSRLEGNTYTRLLPEDAIVRELAAPIVDPADLDDFIAMAILELHGLHEGNLARYRLRPSELQRWQLKRPRQPAPAVAPPPASRPTGTETPRRSRPRSRARSKISR